MDRTPVRPIASNPFFFLVLLFGFLVTSSPALAISISSRAVHQNLGLQQSRNAPDDEWFYYIKDHLGSTMMLTDSTGEAICDYNYEAYGEHYEVSPTTNQAVADANNFLYTGQQLDKDIGQYYLRARFYDAGLGHFTVRDPIRTQGGINMYAYVNGNPVNLSDPSGLDAISDTFRFMSENMENSGVSTKILSKLKDLHSKNLLLVDSLGTTGNVAEWNNFKGTITINSDKIDLSQKYMYQAGLLEAKIMGSTDKDEILSLSQSRDRKTRLQRERLYELSGAFVHEGTHALLGNSWNAKNDETAGYQSESTWVKHLWNRFTQDRRFIRTLDSDIVDSARGKTSYPIRSGLPKP